MSDKSSSREVFYLKYRPQKFSDIVGQDHITKTLLSALISRRTSHAYLFSGPRGTGKTSVARILSKAINCQKPKNGEPCNQCEFCQEITLGKALDVVEIDAASNRGIDEIRELRDKIKFSPAKLSYKIFIIDEVHMLTREAFNALLKTLEEPPEHALFILATTEVHKVPDTILSRCQRFDFKRIKISDLIKYLEKISKKEKIAIDKTSLELIAVNSEGAFRDAANLLDQASSLGQKINADSLQTILGLADISAVDQLIDYLTIDKQNSAIELVNELLEHGHDLVSFNRKLIEHLRHILIFKFSQKDNLIEVTAEQLKKIKDQADKLSTKQLIKFIKLFLEAEKKINLTSLPQLPLEMAILETSNKLSEVSVKEKKEIKKQEQNSEDFFDIKSSNHTKSNANSSKAFNQERKENDKPSQNIGQAFKEIIKNWDAILEQTKHYNYSINAFLKASQPVSLVKDILYLNFIYDFHKDKINEPKNRVIVEESIKKITGESYKIKCQLKPKESSKSTKKENDLFKEALEVFGGEVIE
jgi:DNA polymerase-3 subunit gamma/tau